jgi:hypothetical protein
VIVHVLQYYFSLCPRSLGVPFVSVVSTADVGPTVPDNPALLAFPLLLVSLPLLASSQLLTFVMVFAFLL